MDEYGYNDVAKVSWNDEAGRWELHIDNVLKAHTAGDDKAEHDVNKAELKKLAMVKGYTVIDESAEG